MKDLGLEQAKEVFLKGAGLCGEHPAWEGASHWSILETGFGLGINFLCTWHYWQSLPEQLRPSRLSYVSIEKHPVNAEDLVRSALPWAELGEFAKSLSQQWSGLLPGFHRLSFEGGRVILLLCIGDVQSSLRDLDMQADTFYLDGFSPTRNPQMWSHKVLGHISRKAREGSKLSSWCVSRTVIESLTRHGFECSKEPGLAPKRHRLSAVYSPKTKSHLSLASARVCSQEKKCAVVGAGLAGVCTAYAMAQRGYRVTVFDQESTPASAASSVPLGIFSSQLSLDDNPAARLSRAGVARTRQLLQEVLGAKSDHWGAGGVLERRQSVPEEMTEELKTPSLHVQEKKDRDHHPHQKNEWPQKKRVIDLSGAHVFNSPSALDWYSFKQENGPCALDLLHKQGGWAHPVALITALLAHPKIDLCVGTAVTQITKTQITKTQIGQALDHCASRFMLNNNAELFDCVILANAFSVKELLIPLLSPRLLATKLPELSITYGEVVHAELSKNELSQISQTIHSRDCNVDQYLEHALGPYPALNGAGSFVRTALSPKSSSMRWCAGSTFERVSARNTDKKGPLIRPTGHQAIDLSSALKKQPLIKLRTLSPAAYRFVLQTKQLTQWSNYRLHTSNKLPWVEVIEPGLGVLTALGSKGLTYAPIAAEIIACAFNNEPSPIEQRLAKKLAKFNT